MAIRSKTLTVLICPSGSKRSELGVTFWHHDYQHQGHDPETEISYNGTLVIALPKKAWLFDLILGWRQDRMLLQVLIPWLQGMRNPVPDTSLNYLDQLYGPSTGRPATRYHVDKRLCEHQVVLHRQHSTS